MPAYKIAPEWAGLGVSTSGVPATDILKNSRRAALQADIAAEVPHGGGLQGTSDDPWASQSETAEPRQRRQMLKAAAQKAGLLLKEDDNSSTSNKRRFNHDNVTSKSHIASSYKRLHMETLKLTR